MNSEMVARYRKLIEFAALAAGEHNTRVPSVEELVKLHGDMSDIYSGLSAIGALIGSKRKPLKVKQLKEIFRKIEFELAGPDFEFANAVATSLLEALWRASDSGGFDLASIDVYIGPKARSYLFNWGEMMNLKMPGLRMQ